MELATQPATPPGSLSISSGDLYVRPGVQALGLLFQL